MIFFYTKVYKQTVLEFSQNLTCLHTRMICDVTNGNVYFIRHFDRCYQP